MSWTKGQNNWGANPQQSTGTMEIVNPTEQSEKKDQLIIYGSVALILAIVFLTTK